MKSALIALVIGLFSVGTLAIADDAPNAAAANPSANAEVSAKPVKKMKKHHKKQVKAAGEKVEKTEKTEKVEQAPAAERNNFR